MAWAAPWAPAGIGWIRGAVSVPQYRIVIQKSSNKLSLFDGEELVRTYPVATGRSRETTPEGSFRMVFKTTCPGWTNPETGRFIQGCTPENPLGDRWLGFNAHGTNGRVYGIHGTNDPSSIGSHITLGCVRMYPADVRELYEKIPIGTPVVIKR